MNSSSTMTLIPHQRRKAAQRPWVIAGLAAALLSACGGSNEPDTETSDEPSINLASTTPSSSAGAASPASSGTAAIALAAGKKTSINSALIPSARPGSSTFDIVQTGEMPYRDNGGIGAFRNVCQFSHMNFDDALVFPGRQGASHLHTYFGNTSMRFDSTAEALPNEGGSTCRGGIANRSAYWVPSMVDTREGRPLAPEKIDIYYKTGYAGISNAAIRPWPRGFRMITGSAGSTGSQPGIISYTCNGGGKQDSIPNCNGTVTMMVTFPQCWDGVNLSSPDHKSHVAFPSGGRCPSSHPVPTPELALHVHYATTHGSSATWRLSSDSAGAPAGSSGHADWVHAWDTDIMDTWVRRVINLGLSGGSHMLGDGRVMNCRFAGCQ